MAWDVGDVYPSRVTVRNADGDPAAPSAIGCTVTYPDGTSAAIAHIDTISTGVYEAGLQLTMPGRYVLSWASTGLNASAFTDVVTALDPAYAPVIGLDEAKAHLNITSATSDEELRTFLDVVTAKGEEVTGRVFGQRTVTEIVDDADGDVLILTRTPVLSVTSITYGTQTIPRTAYRLRGAAGLLRYLGGEWPDADDATELTVTYIAGYTRQPPQDVQGAKELLRHLWSTQRGTIRRGPDADDWSPSMAFSIPRRVQEMWAAEVPRMGL